MNWSIVWTFFFEPFFVYWYNSAHFHIWRYIGGNRLVDQECQLVIYAFLYLIIPVEILFGRSDLSSFKEKVILETSALSIADIKTIKYLRVGCNQNTFIRKSDGGLNIYSNFRRIVIKGVCNFRVISDWYIIICNSSGSSKDRVT